jgi:four helix bundle protein
VARLLRTLPAGVESEIVRPQLFRAATSAASNYRAGCRARSRREFIAKLGVVIEETDESDFWLGFSVDLDLLDRRAVQKLRQEAGELVAIFTASRKTAEARLSNQEAKRR